MTTNRYWHYTCFCHLQSISSDGVIKPASLYVPPGVKHGVWFSTDPDWERTVVKTIFNEETGEETDLLSRDELFDIGFVSVKTEKSSTIIHPYTPIRLEVNPHLVQLKSWQNYKKNSGDSKEFVRGLQRVAKKWGANPKQWYIVYGDVPIKNLITIERWNGEGWIDLYIKTSV